MTVAREKGPSHLEGGRGRAVEVLPRVRETKVWPSQKKKGRRDRDTKFLNYGAKGKKKGSSGKPHTEKGSREEERDSRPGAQERS